MAFACIWHRMGIAFQLSIKILCLAKDHWRGFSTRKAHMVHIVNYIRNKMVYTDKGSVPEIRIWSILLIISESKIVYTGKEKCLFVFQLLGECYRWWTKESPRARVPKFYDRLRFVRSVLRTSTFSVLKLTDIVIWWVFFTPSLLAFACFWHLLGIAFQFFIKIICSAKDHWRGFSTHNAHYGPYC